MYTIIAGLMVISGLLIVLVMLKGSNWRASEGQREASRQLQTENDKK